MIRARPLLYEPAPLPTLAALPAYRWLVVGTVCVGAFLGQLDASIAGLVLPTLEEVFQAPVASVEWVAISYLLVLASLVVPLGRLADLVGRKALYSSGFVVFIAGSALAGLAPSLPWLIAFRAVQAVGAAMLQANSVAIIAATVDRRRLGRAIGIQGAAQAVGLAVGPTVGGLLIASLGWQWVFFIAVPFGLVGSVLAWLVLPCTPRSAGGSTEAERFDWAGALLLGPSVLAGMLGLTQGNAWGWTSPGTLGAFALMLVLLASFGVIERRARFPLVDLALFRRPLFSAGIVAGLLSYAVLFGSLFLLPFYLQRILGHSPAETGLLLTPIPLALGLFAPAAGLLADKLGSRLPTVAGMALAALALGTLAFQPRAPFPIVLAILSGLGLGLGLFTPANNSAIMGSAPTTRLGVAGGVLNMTRSLGTSLGVAATGAVFALRISASMGYPVERTTDVAPAALLPAFQQTLLGLAVVALVAALVSLARGLHTPAPTAPGEPAAAGEQVEVVRTPG